MASSSDDIAVTLTVTEMNEITDKIETANVVIETSIKRIRDLETELALIRAQLETADNVIRQLSTRTPTPPSRGTSDPRSPTFEFISNERVHGANVSRGWVDSRSPTIAGDDDPLGR